jgi:ABC-type dipeptide/oligopeptide/nickel transport system permease component
VKTYVAQRLGIGFLTLLGMSIVIFGMLRLAPATSWTSCSPPGAT